MAAAVASATASSALLQPKRASFSPSPSQLAPPFLRLRLGLGSSSAQHLRSGAVRQARRGAGVVCLAAPSFSSSAVALPAALLFDCDGVLVDTEKDGHRISFNETFAEKELDVTWDEDLYGELLKIGGGKERMTAYFNRTGWPANAPKIEEERKDFIALLHKRKTELFMALIEKKLLPLRPGVARLIDEALGKGSKVAVCSTSNEKALGVGLDYREIVLKLMCILQGDSCVLQVSAIVSFLLGPDRAEKISIFAGDVVPKKKPDPAIYLLAANTLGIEPSRCVVVEDSAIGLAAAKSAGMTCIITKSSYTAEEDFLNADAVFDCIGDPPEIRFDLEFCGKLLEKQYVR